MRDDFPKRTCTELAKRAGMTCSNPDCRRRTCGPQANPERAISIGVAAHITAAAPSGPRYDPSMSEQQRKSAQNGIWLCGNCSRLIDADLESFTVQILQQWKADAERQALTAVQGGARPDNSAVVNVGSARMVVTHTGPGDIVIGPKHVPRPKIAFTPGPQHIGSEVVRQLHDLVNEIVERLTVTGGDKSRAYSQVWGKFKSHFGLGEIRELPRERAFEAISYLQQWRASKNSRFRNNDPEKFRAAHLRGVWAKANELGLDREEVHGFAARKLGHTRAISSLDELSNDRLARLDRFLTSELRKLRRKQGSSVIGGRATSPAIGVPRA